MKVNRKKLEPAMARACMESRDLPAAAGLPRPTVQNAIVYKGGDTPVMTKAEYADIPAGTIARFLIEKFGADVIFNGGEGDTR